MVDTMPQRATARPSATRRLAGRLARRRWFAPTAVGIAALLFDGIFAWVSSLWYDEAATVSASTRSLPQLFALLQHVDAVHGFYYLLMHGWFEIVGYSPFTLRLPSTLATAAAAALLVVLMRRFTPERTAVVAGVVFLLLPRVTWMATEGRSYALSTLLALALTWVFVQALAWNERDRAQRILIWTVYGVLVVVGGAMFIYLGLVVLAHGVAAVLVAMTRRRAGEHGALRSVRQWALASVIGGAALLPLIRLDASQTGQIQWIKPLDVVTLYSVFVNQFSLGNWAFAIAAWVGAVLGAVMLIRRTRGGDGEATRSKQLSLLIITGSWIVIPTAGLLIATVLLTPLYSPRYVTFAAPAFAGLVAVGLTTVPLRVRHLKIFTALGLVLLLGLTLPSWTRERSDSGKQYTAWKQVSQLVASERAAEPIGQTDAVIYGPLKDHPEADMAMLALAYPQEFSGLIDLNAGIPGPDLGTLWATRIPLADGHARLGNAQAIWLVTSDSRDWRPSVTAELAGWGYQLDDSWSFQGANVLRYLRN